MKRYRIIIIGAITLLIAIFIGFTVRINMIFPNEGTLLSEMR